MKSFVNQLQEASIQNPWRDCRLLLAHCLGLTYEEVFLRDFTILPDTIADTFTSYIRRRANHEPLSRILGKREFWGQSFRVTPDTLDPRPDTETLIEAVLDCFPDRQVPYRILDVGTGTGCLLVSLLNEYPKARGMGVDICPKALTVAQHNAERLVEDPNRYQFVCTHWVDALEEKFDIIVSNPPYIGDHEILSQEVSQYDPKLALFAGIDGLQSYRHLVPALKKVSHPETQIFFELGHTQYQAVRDIILQFKGIPCSVKKDHSNYSRVVAFRYVD